MQTLNNLSAGSEGRVLRIDTEGSMRRRFQDIGIISGAAVKCLLKSFTGDPAAYLIQDAVIAIRNDDAKTIILDEQG